MGENELRWQLRQLPRELDPPRDLWPGIAARLPGPDQLHLVVAGAESLHQARQCERHAIDFGWPGFGDHSNSQCRIFGLKVFHQQVFGRCMFHEPMLPC